MNILSVIIIVLFCTVLCIFEIPKMLKKKLFKELVIFSIVLLCGFIIGILKSFGSPVSNPSDWISAVYSPFLSHFENYMK